MSKGKAFFPSSAARSIPPLPAEPAADKPGELVPDPVIWRVPHLADDRMARDERSHLGLSSAGQDSQSMLRQQATARRVQGACAAHGPRCAQWETNVSVSKKAPQPRRELESVARTAVVSDRGRHHGSRLPKYHSIKAMAEALDVSHRTLRRWIANGDLVVHRVGGVVRVADGDLKAFLALHREA